MSHEKKKSPRSRKTPPEFRDRLTRLRLSSGYFFGISFFFWGGFPSFFLCFCFSFSPFPVLSRAGPRLCLL